MNICLVVAQGSQKGKEIPIKGSQFLIGRDPQCQLRPASPMISRRHCAILIRKDKVFLRDFGSTNGTLINDQRVEGEQELHDQDRLHLEPLVFTVRIETSTAAAKRLALPDTADEESIAALLLDLKEHSPSLDNLNPDPDSIPTGSTIMEVPALPPPEAEKPAEKKPEAPNTSTAAKAILDKYSRRKRT